jgi:hypothetical protein
VFDDVHWKDLRRFWCFFDKNTEGVLSKHRKAPPQYFYQNANQIQFILRQFEPSYKTCKVEPAVSVVAVPLDDVE